MFPASPISQVNPAIFHTSSGKSGAALSDAVGARWTAFPGALQAGPTFIVAAAGWWVRLYRKGRPAARTRQAGDGPSPWIGWEAMATSVTCPHCHTRNQATARFCGRCGQPLGDAGGATGASAEPRPEASFGPARHPDPLSPPTGFEVCEEMPDLFYRWEAAWGGSMLIGTETLAVIVFNAGYPLEEVVLKIAGQDDEGREVFALDHELAELPRGKEVTIEVPSYELSAPAAGITVSLSSGRYASSM